MTTRYGTIILAAQLTFGLAASAQEHLEPEEGILNQRESRLDYAMRLREVLLKDAANHHLARMVCLPAFEPEWIVTLVREDGQDPDAPHSYFVEYVGAEKSYFLQGSLREFAQKSHARPLTVRQLNP